MSGMVIPKYWSEARAQQRTRNKQVTVRRFGWSDDSEEAALRMAEQRAADALARLLSGEKPLRREPKVAYNGADGVPIREEVLERHGETVITRNIYGARCLNTPDVLFADVDSDDAPTHVLFMPVLAVLAITGAVVGKSIGGWGLAVLLMLVALAVASPVSKMLLKLRQLAAGGPEQELRTRVHRFLQSHPGWCLRIYRTPAGFRLLAMHGRFDPLASEVADFFNAIGADPAYVRMCMKQRCFRARLSAKPWRIGLARIKPRPGVWPINPERLPERKRWVADYERKAEGYAACAYMATLGNGRVDAEVERVRELHDAACRAESGLPLA